jgi:hypothetical protein
MPDLWPPDLAPATELPPVAMLREQAAHLATRTQGQIEGLVKTDKAGANLVHTFYLVVPALDNYSYRLLMVGHPLQFYPLSVDAEVMGQSFSAENQQQYEQILKAVLSSEQTRRVIGALLSQVQHNGN